MFPPLVTVKELSVRVKLSTSSSPILSGLFLTASGETDFTGHYVLLFWCLIFTPIALLFRRYFQEG
jgi:hypothetical protein